MGKAIGRANARRMACPPFGCLRRRRWWGRRKGAFAQPTSSLPPVDSGDILGRDIARNAPSRFNQPILRRWETIASVRDPDRDCPDMQRLPSRTRPGDRPPVSRFEIARLMWSRRKTGKAVRETGRPFSFVIPGAPLRREPGMTAYGFTRTGATARRRASSRRCGGGSRLSFAAPRRAHPAGRCRGSRHQTAEPDCIRSRAGSLARSAHW